jgi:lipopolysaccharide assembly outer membrane protein LptD (OstA)
MGKMLLSIALVSGLGMYAYAQTTARPPVSLSLHANTITTRPASGEDGIVRIGRADSVVTASGNIVIVINGTRVTADTAVWHWGSKVIELAGGSVRIELPAQPNSIEIGPIDKRDP